MRAGKRWRYAPRPYRTARVRTVSSSGTPTLQSRKRELTTFDLSEFLRTRPFASRPWLESCED